MAAPKLGVIHYNWPGYDGLEPFLARAREIGYRYCELWASDIWDEALLGQGDPDQGALEAAAETVTQQLERHDIQVATVSAQNDFIQDDADVMGAQLVRYRNLCRAVPLLGTDLLRSDGGWNREGKVPRERWDGMLVEAFLRAVEFADEFDVRIALDNHGDATNDGDWQLSLIERVGSPRLGVNLDTMNYRWFGHDLATIERYYRILAPHTFHTHLKDGRNPRPDYQGAALGEGEIDLATAVRCLKEAGYEGAWTAEYEGPEAVGGVGYEKCFAWMAKNV